MKKALVIRYSSIGDIVLTSPIVRCLHEQLGMQIDYLTKKSMRQLIDSSPYIRRIHTIEKDNKEVIGDLLLEDYDVIIDLHKNLRSHQVKRRLDKAAYYTFEKKNIAKWLLVNLKWDQLPGTHLVDRYFEGIAPLGVTNDGAGLDHFISEADEAYGRAFHQEQGDYTVLVLGANFYTKRPPLGIWQDLVSRYPDRKYILLGGQDVADVANQLGGAERVHNYCGRTTLGQSASIIKRAQKVVSGDTGLMHIAAAYRVPLVSVWGSTVPKFGMYPYYGDQSADHHLSEVNGLSCRPCSKLGHDRCPKGHFRCMVDQNITL